MAGGGVQDLRAALVLTCNAFTGFVIPAKLNESIIFIVVGITNFNSSSGTITHSNQKAHQPARSSSLRRGSSGKY